MDDGTEINGNRTKKIPLNLPMLTSQTIEQQNISRPFSNSSPQKLCLFAGEFIFQNNIKEGNM